jgi:CheY-like chemotaxis protein
MIKVMLVDDQNLVRKGVRSLLELSEEIEVVAEAADGAEAIRMVPEVMPDVVLLDMRMPGLSGLDVLRELADQDRLPPTIILTTFDDDELVLAGIQAGARGYLLKDVALADLVNAIKTRGRVHRQAGGDPALAEGIGESAQRVFQPGPPRSADGPGDRDPAVDGRGLQQQGNRELTGRGGGHRQEPRLQHTLQDGRAGPHAGGVEGVRTGADLAADSNRGAVWGDCGSGFSRDCA